MALDPSNTNLNIFKGDFVKIKCKVTPQLEENLTQWWTLGNKNYIGDTFNHKVYDNNMLTCLATNRAGDISKTVFISVKGLYFNYFGFLCYVTKDFRKTYLVREV